MPSGSEKASEFRRYRQALSVLYGVAISAGFFLLTASIVRELFFRPVVQLPGPTLQAEHPRDLTRCNHDVTNLYEELGRETERLLALPRSRKQPDILGEWEQFSRKWLTRWEEVNAWCRFPELAGGPMGETYDRMARVHSGLVTMRLKYQSLLVRFDKHQAAELTRMRRELDQSLALLREVQGASNEGAP